MSTDSLESLEKELLKPRRRKKNKVKGTGFARQKKLVEESDYYQKSKNKKKVKFKEKSKK